MTRLAPIDPTVGDPAWYVDQLLGALGEGVYGVDVEGRAAFLNPAASQLLGYAAEELLGHRQHDVIHCCAAGGGPYPASKCPIYAVLEDGRVRHVTDERFCHKDGHCFPVEYTASPVLAEGRVVGAVVVFRDITQRLETETALRRAHEQQAALLENLADAAWMKDAELRYVAVNEAFVHGAGRSRESFIGRTVHDLLGPEDASRYDEADRRVLEGGDPVTVEERLPWGGAGQDRWIETKKNPIRASDGRVVGLVAVARDVTERKRQEAADQFLAEAGEVIIASLAWTETLQGIAALLVPRMGDWCVVSIFSPDGRVESVESRASEPAVGETLRALLARHPDAYGPENDLVGRAVLNGHGELIEVVTASDLESLAGVPGEVASLSALDPRSALVVPLLADHGATGGLVLVRTPGRPAFEAPDLLLIEEVAQRAALAIQHARQHRAANEAIQARDEVLRVVAHDLRGLASTVALSARTLLDSSSDERGRRGAQIIEKTTRRMDRLIQDILDVSRVEAGWLPLEPTPLDPDSLVREAVDAAEAPARERGVDLVREPGDSLPQVRADRGRLLQVLANLLGNAIQFTPDGGTIRIRAKRLGNEIVFCVSDDGPGIAPEDLPHVFDRFWQARRAPHGGAGLGLAIARGIVGAHGGRIWAASEPETGSRFCFTIPILEVHPSEGPQSGPGPQDRPRPEPCSPEPPGDDGADCATVAPLPPSAAALGPTSIGGRGGRPVRVLVVDDHEAIRHGVRVILAADTAIEVVDEATHGEEAIRKVGELDPDVVVMDLSLPGIDGFEAIRRIGTLGRRTRVLVLTAHAPEKSLVKAMEAGACGFVHKATAHRDLVSALRTVLQGEVFLDARSNHVLVRSLERALEARRRLATLSDHEREIVRLTAEGYTAQEIADQVFLSHHTVASYRSQAMRKLGLEHRSDLVRFSLETELISAD